MKKAAGYALFAKNLSAGEAQTRFDDVATRIQTWLDSKGVILDAEDGQRFEFIDGRAGEYSSATFQSSVGTVLDHRLHEPTEGVFVGTQVSVLRTVDSVVVYVQLEAGGGDYQLGPTSSFDVHCPLIVLELVGAYADWQLEDAVISRRPYKFFGESDVPNLEGVLWHPKRNLPVIVVSGKDDEVLTPTFADELAEELVGVALVCTIDSPTSRGLTNSRGKEWSCFNGAIRIYWPNLELLNSPFRHPFWTRASLMAQSNDDGAVAAENLKGQLRRRLLSLSAFSMPEPKGFMLVRDSSEYLKVDTLRAKLRAGEEWEALAEDYARENAALKLQAGADSERIKELAATVLNLNVALQWRDEDGIGLEPEVEPPPNSVEDAVAIARRRFKDDLFFGSDVDSGVKGLAADAGPPDKILSYLALLAELARTRRSSEALGVDAIKWLKGRGVSANCESETTSKSPSDRLKRSWNDGFCTRYFDFHLKPSTSVDSGYCARIYFDYDSTRELYVVGWVGRHP